jgi:RHS repeat-associated protein
VYYPFGRTQPTSPQASFQVSRRFTGQVFDAESGLYYYNARYYDPELGRFIQPDTKVPDFSNPQSYNRYSYCVNDPLRYTDPTGHDFVINAGLVDGPVPYMTARSTLGQLGASVYNMFPLVDNSIHQVLRPVNAAFDGAGYAVHDAVLFTTGDEQLAQNGEALPLLLGGEVGAFGKLEEAEAMTETADEASETASQAIKKPDYCSIPNPKPIKVGGDFTAAQKADALEVNKAANNGVVRSDGDGRMLQKPKKSQKGVTPSPNEWQFDHKKPKAKGGDNSSGNIQLLSREENRNKSDK